MFLLLYKITILLLEILNFGSFLFKNTMKKIAGLFLLVVSVLSLSAQEKADSLLSQLKTAKGEQKVKTLNELFKAYINTDPVKATEYTREALSFALEISDDRGMAASYNNLGVAYRNQGALDKALEYYLISLQMYQKIDNKEGIATSKNNIGNIYSIKKDQVQASKYLEESNKLFLELNDETKIIGSYNNLGNLYNELHVYDQAMKYYDEASRRSEKINASNTDPLTNMGNLMLKQNNFDKAMEYYKKAMPLAEKENNQIGILSLLVSMGEASLKANNLSQANAYLSQALNICNELQAYVYEPGIYKNLAATYAKQNRMDKAYDAMLRYDQAREKIYGEESSRKIAQMEMALSIQEKEKELEVLKKEDDLKSMELKQTQMVVALVFLSVISVIMIASLFIQKKKV
jgi:tetratricopeptide (TPR) repeat protein